VYYYCRLKAKHRNSSFAYFTGETYLSSVYAEQEIFYIIFNAIQYYCMMPWDIHWHTFYQKSQLSFEDIWSINLWMEFKFFAFNSNVDLRFSATKRNTFWAKSIENHYAWRLITIFMKVVLEKVLRQRTLTPLLF